jgi:ATP-dependent RNA helicase DDX49/DBP8
MDGGIALFSSKPKKPRAARPAAQPENDVNPAAAQPAQPAAQPNDDPAAPGGGGLTAVDAAPQQPGNAQAEEEEEAATFGALGVSEWLEKVCRGLGMTAPTEVQRGCVPAILAGRDVIGVAQTGSGKTAAFALPILQKLAKDPYGVFALVLTPTRRVPRRRLLSIRPFSSPAHLSPPPRRRRPPRHPTQRRELAFQLADQFRALGAGMSLAASVVVGGLDQQAQARELARRPHIVVATPGRLKALLDQDASLGRAFARAAFLVLDEADRLLEPSFEAELSAALRAMPPRRQTLLFSATMTRTLGTLRASLLADAMLFEAYEGLRTADNLRQEFLLVPAKVKEVYLAYLLRGLADRGVRSAIVFAGTCRGCALLSALLAELGLPAAALHSRLPQRRRMAALERFKGGGVPVLLATDVASRGLDIPTVDLVVNFDLPSMARDYVHRVARTARAGRAGWSLSFVSQHDVELVQRIEALTGERMGAFHADEAAALKGITEVYAARRAAALKVADEEERSADKRGGGGARKAPPRKRPAAEGAAA